VSDRDEIEILGVTCDSRLNVFRPTDLETATNDPNAKRLDYIFTSQVTITSAQVVLAEFIPDHLINYSDHFAVRVVLQFPNDAYEGRPERSLKLSTSYLPPEIFTAIRDITNAYILREEKYSWLRISHFYLSLAVCVGMLIGVWFVSNKGSIFVMMFFSTMCSWCGVLDGVIGFVWGRWELRGLREFASEMELATRVYAEEGTRGRVESSA
jgi:sphingomyelin phosphodiesterase 2